MAQIQPAVKKETARIALGTVIGSILMFAAFALLHGLSPDTVPFDYRVILGGVFGSIVAIGNFFFMGLTVQKIASGDNDEQAFKDMKASYRFRTMSQLLWVVLAMVIPVFNGAAGIIPLFFPSISIKLMAILGIIKATPNS